ncbi:hypothetical protein BU16DRAFT_569124 [Lophium mytilinum]|uniref:Glycosyl transferase CAP10 domain-containing protein n=1 Tax=Lophium mytilinum TaxID=390894 RepID=A0A6A6RIS3_9PEZI|nr:hypothetical protein BU16DRAFT_569124 [Lophium mytilinum]
MKSLSLTEAQCACMFPRLTREVDRAVGRGNFTFERESGNYKGMVQGRIENGNLHIISVSRESAEEVIWERTAVLHQLHRALLTSPEPLPDTVFALVVNDNPKNNSWSFARPSKEPVGMNYWLMPHFSYWSWPLPFVGMMSDVLSKIAFVEETIPWESKVDKAVWRGTPWFNPAGSPNLRPGLLEAAGGQKQWADVQSLKWESGGKAKNAIAIEDFCKYKYVIYAEGVTYSGRLHYHQACASVLLTPKFNWLQHTSHLIRAVNSSSLLSSDSIDYSHANAVEVSSDWSDLEATVMYLRNHQEIARSIAQRQREVMTEQGHLSPAAETCYWRALIREWSKVAVASESDDGRGWGNVEGARWETFSLNGKVE